MIAARALLVLALAACGSRGGSVAPPPAELGEHRFPHPLHAEIACTTCHDPGAVAAGRPAVPGADDHAPCDRDQCHRAEFLAPPGPLCQVCHSAVDPTVPDGSPLAAYPPEDGLRVLAARFSHALHLDFDTMEDAVGFHVSCSDCHPQRDDGTLGAPAHPACARCHAPEAAPPGTPAMTECERCHAPRPRWPDRARDLITGDLRFRHAEHRTDRRGDRISCTECHTETTAAEIDDRHPDPPTSACVACHDDPARAPTAVRMAVCETCHTTRSRGFSSLPPRSHLPARERPEDHTLAFRLDHAAEARADSVRCATCHTFMSGSPRATCDECHQVMRPHDHMVTWREFDHGPAAAARADRCATCHVGTFCTACHSVPPRSHMPLPEFRAGGHAGPASFNPRSCATCHIVDRFCTECHDVRMRP